MMCFVLKWNGMKPSVPYSVYPTNALIRGDNLVVLKTLIREKDEGRIKNTDGAFGVRLVYIDPPFSTGRGFKTKAGKAAYDDTLAGFEFLKFMKERLLLMREVISEDGSIFVHLDWKMAHCVKVMMDGVFGVENFLNDIIWHYGGRGAKAISGQFSRNHDVILWYKKGRRHVFNRTYAERRVKKGEAGFRRDESGRWFKTAPRGDYTDMSVARLEKAGRIHKTRNNKVRIKYFVKEDGPFLVEQRPIGDVWDDIPDAMHMPAKEKTGYPTQKPEALLARIISASTNPGDVVLDAFSGSGTTLVAAERLGRRWIGIDSGRLAIETAKERLLKAGAGRFTLIKATRGRKLS